MPVLLFKVEAPGRARVTTIIHQPDKVDPVVVDSGINVTDIPAHDLDEEYQHPVLYVNPDTGDVWHEGDAIPIDPLRFKLLLTKDERKAFRKAVKSNEDAEDFYDLLNTSKELRLDDPIVIEGVQFLVAIGVITQVRADEILALGA